MKKVLIISNIPSPYRTALFRYLQTEQKDYRFQVLYTSRAEADRAWSTQQELEDTFFQDSKVLSVKGGEVGGRRLLSLFGERPVLQSACPLGAGQDLSQLLRCVCQIILQYLPIFGRGRIAGTFHQIFQLPASDLPVPAKSPEGSG